MRFELTTTTNHVLPPMPFVCWATGKRSTSYLPNIYTVSLISTGDISADNKHDRGWLWPIRERARKPFPEFNIISMPIYGSKLIAYYEYVHRLPTAVLLAFYLI